MNWYKESQQNTWHDHLKNYIDEWERERPPSFESWMDKDAYKKALKDNKKEALEEWMSRLPVKFKDGKGDFTDEFLRGVRLFIQRHYQFDPFPDLDYNENDPDLEWREQADEVQPMDDEQLEQMFSGDDYQKTANI